MLYDIDEEKPVIRELYNTSYYLSKEEKDEIKRHIKERIDPEEAKRIVENQNYHAPLVRIGLAKVNGGVKFKDREYRFEGGYKYAGGYSID
jgi:hypothetical protein